MDDALRSSLAKQRSPAKSSKRRVLSAALAAGLLLTVPACSIPALRRADPGAALPASYKGASNVEERDTSLENSAQLGYREFFSDPAVTELMDQALAGNQELKILAQDVRIAYLDVQRQRGAYFPFVTLGSRAGLEKPSLFTPGGAVEEQLEVLPGKSFPDPLPNFLIAADVEWEIDIWRKLRNARDAASLRYLGTAAGRNYVVTRMVAEVAENYYELLALDNRLVTLDRTITLQQQSLEVSKSLMAAGRGTELAVQRFEAEVRKNQSEKLIIQQEITEAENRINFLAGRYPQPIQRMQVEYVDLNLHPLSVGVPSQQLLNRSDIREAEREVAASGLDVRVARARFYPSLILTAGVGLEAFDTKYLLTTPESLIYGVAGNLVGPLINRKAIKADYLTANARQLQAIYKYQQTILNAHIEVVNRMAMVENYGRSIETKKQQLIALESSVDAATKLFQGARGEYLDVLLSQRDMMEAKLVLIETKQQQLTAVINTYQALGGGGRPGVGRDFLLDLDTELPDGPPIADPSVAPSDDSANGVKDDAGDSKDVKASAGDGGVLKAATNWFRPKPS